MKTCLGELESFSHKDCLDTGEISIGFQQKWCTCMCWVTAGNGHIRIPNYGRAQYSGGAVTQPKRDLLTDCCMEGPWEHQGLPFTKQWHC